MHFDQHSTEKCFNIKGRSALCRSVISAKMAFWTDSATERCADAGEKYHRNHGKKTNNLHFFQSSSSEEESFTGIIIDILEDTCDDWPKHSIIEK